MKKILLVLGLILVLAVLTLSNVYAFPLSTTKLAWTMPTTTIDGQPINVDTAITSSKVFCGKSSGVYTVTKVLGVVTEELAKNVPLTIGTWHCVITISNKYGMSPFSNEVMFPLEGSVPSDPFLDIISILEKILFNLGITITTSEAELTNPAKERFEGRMGNKSMAGYGAGKVSLKPALK